MQKKNVVNNKKLIKFIIIFTAVFLIFLFFYFKKHSYTLNYKINNIEVTEKYHREQEYYEFIFKYDNEKYSVISLDKYSNKRKLVKEIKVDKKTDDVCLSFKSDNIKLYPICKNKDGYYFPSQLVEFKKSDSYKNIQIDKLNQNKYLLWNYHEFIYLTKTDKKSIDLFNKDIYKLNLVYAYEDYLIIPDYDEEYKFKKIYLIDSKNGKVSEKKLRYELYFDSYFLGEDKNKVYLYDIKSETEYYLDFKKDEIYKSKYKIINNGKWESISNQKLKNNKLSFTYNELVSYYIKNNKLYGKINGTEVLIINRPISKIVKSDKLDVYYISNDTLYYFNPLKKEKALLKYSEWEFNQENMIHIF